AAERSATHTLLVPPSFLSELKDGPAFAIDCLPVRRGHAHGRAPALETAHAVLAEFRSRFDAGDRPAVGNTCSVIWIANEEEAQHHPVHRHRDGAGHRRGLRLS